MAGFGDLRNDNDPNMTYEGENNVLLQQTSNWLLSVRQGGYDKFPQNSPLESAAFLSEYDEIIKRKFNFVSSQDALEPKSKRRIAINYALS